MRFIRIAPDREFQINDGVLILTLITDFRSSGKIELTRERSGYNFENVDNALVY